MKKAYLLIALGIVFIGLSAVMWSASEVRQDQQAAQRAQALLDRYEALPVEMLLQHTDDDDSSEQAAEVTAEPQPKAQAPVPENVLGVLQIPAIDLKLPVLDTYSEAYLKTAPCHYSGPASPNDWGNLVICGHNYRSSAHFSKLDELKKGDQLTLTTEDQQVYTYVAEEIELIEPSATDKLANDLSTRALTLFTCTDDKKLRLVVRCRWQSDKE